MIVFIVEECATYFHDEPSSVKCLEIDEEIKQREKRSEKEFCETGVKKSPLSVIFLWIIASRHGVLVGMDTGEESWIIVGNDGLDG